MSDIQPLFDRVIVIPDEAASTTSGGIIIPDNAKERPARGTVLSVGPGKKDEPTICKKGDIVVYSKYAGTEVTIDGRQCLIMRESDIMAIF